MTYNAKGVARAQTFVGLQRRIQKLEASEKAARREADEARAKGNRLYLAGWLAAGGDPEASKVRVWRQKRSEASKELKERSTA